MSTIKALIIDDEKNARSSIRGMLETWFPDVSVLGEAATVPDAVKLIQSTQPDVIFLDIEMPGYSGLELIDFFRPPQSFQIIFTTAYSDFAIQAFEQAALDYLLKPIRKEQLERALNRLRSLLQKPAIQQDRGVQEKILMPSAEGNMLVQPAEILYFEASGAYTQVVMTEGRKLLVSKSLSEFARLQERGPFIRIHRSYLINLNHLQRVLRADGGSVIMTDGAQLPISGERKADLTQWMDQFRI
jgi:two-component system LytT family response regulator